MNLTLRLTEETYKMIREIALNEDRSINSEINYLIKKYYKEKKEENKEQK